MACAWQVGSCAEPRQRRVYITPHRPYQSVGLWRSSQSVCALCVCACTPVWPLTPSHQSSSAGPKSMPAAAPLPQQPTAWMPRCHCRSCCRCTVARRDRTSSSHVRRTQTRFCPSRGPSKRGEARRCAPLGPSSCTEHAQMPPPGLPACLTVVAATVRWGGDQEDGRLAACVAVRATCGRTRTGYRVVEGEPLVCSHSRFAAHLHSACTAPLAW